VNGCHDVGGMHGFGPIRREDDEPYFHEKWEERVFGLFFGCFAGGHFNIDEFRHSIEHMGPDYYQTSYYEHWLHAIQDLLVKRGVLTTAQIDRRMRELAAQGSA
jgi:nitrile hydratase subunit beta